MNQDNEKAGKKGTTDVEDVGESGDHRLLVETIEGYVDEKIDDETVIEAYERVTDGFFSVDRNWRLTYVNGKATELLNAEKEDVLGERLEEVLPATEGTGFQRKMEEAAKEQQPVSFDGYHGSLDAWFHVNIYPSEDGLSVYFHDVTERVEREKKLERYGRIVESCPDALWMFSVDFDDVLFVNSAYEDVLGQSVDALEDDPTAFVEATHPDDRDLLREKIERAQDGEEVDFEVRVNPQEGYDRHVWVRGHPVYDNGELVAVTGFTRDVTERVEREREVREIKERLDLAVEAAEMGVWDWNVAEGEVEVNEEWKEMVGHEVGADTVAFEEWEDLVHPDDLPDAKDAIDKHLDGATDIYDAEFRMRDGDGWRWVRSVGRVVERDEDGEPRRAVGVHIDVDDRKSDEAELERRNEYLREIQDATQRMISATERGDVEEILVGSAANVFEDAEFYTWDEGSLRNGDRAVESGDGDPAWEAFSRGEVMVTEENGGTARPYDEVAQDCSCSGRSDADVSTCRLDVPVGDAGVLTIDVMSYCVCDSVYWFVDSVAASAEDSLERIENEDDLRGVADRLREKNDELRRLSEINAVVRSLIKKVVEADSRDEIRRTVCDQLLEVEGWEYAWFAERNGEDVEATCCSDEDFTDTLVDALDGSPLSETLEDGEVRVVDDVARRDVSDWRRAVLAAGFLSSATVPVRYGSRRLGVLEVYSSETGAFEGEYSDALVDAARVAGYAITAAEQMDAVLSGGFERITVRVDADEVDCVFSRLVDALDVEFRVNAVAPGDEGTLVYFRTDADADELHAAADEIGVDISETMNGYGARVGEMSVVERAMELGGRVSRYGPGEGSLHVDVDLPQGRDARDLLDAVRNEYPSVELVARKSDGEPQLGDEPLGELTDRQRTVLRLAYESGFFETPREKTGQELADSMGITATTFHQHLRSAERKVVDAVLDSE